MFIHHRPQTIPINAPTLPLSSQAFYHPGSPLYHLGNTDFPFPALLLLLFISSLNCCLLTSVKRQPCVQPSDRRTRSGLTHAEPKQILPQCSVKQTHLRESSNVNISKGWGGVKSNKKKAWLMQGAERHKTETFCSQTFAVICLVSRWLPIRLVCLLSVDQMNCFHTESES